MRLFIKQHFLKSLLEQKKCRLLHHYPKFSLVECDTFPPELAKDDAIRTDNTPIRVNSKTVLLNDYQFDITSHPHTLIKFIGPIDPVWLQQLKANEVNILFFCPPYGACVELPERLKPVNLAEIFPFLCAAAPYLEHHCSRGLSKDRERLLQAGIPDDSCDLVFFKREDRAKIENELATQNIPILNRSNYKLRIRYTDSLQSLRVKNGVKIADYSRAPQLCANEDLSTAVARPESGIGETSLRGKGQVIAVADTGLDSGEINESLHKDFQGRVKTIVSIPLNSSWDSYAIYPRKDDGAADRNSGHGTHVAGLALGSGALSSGLHQGIAPDAELVFQALEEYVEIKNEYQNEFQNGYYLSGRPLDLGDLYGQAREFGARIHVNAWGDEANGQYTDDCYETDHFLHEHDDALVLFAAGNSGADRDGNRVLDSRSLYAPASAKNVIAVGATEGGKDQGLRASWGIFDAQNSRFRSSVDRSDRISGETDRIALFSSTGPTQDGRIKPDLCAPGTNLASPRSRLAAGKGWGLASPLPHYMYNGGTSMAVGVVGGAAAIIREAWENYLGHPPSGPAIKALLILSTSPVISRRNNEPEPLNVAGFGRIQITDALPQHNNRKILLIDKQGQGLTTGEIQEFSITVSQGSDLKAVLNWYDVPGETLINNLNLSLIAPSGETTWGNHNPNDAGQPDNANNVEMINLTNLDSGLYTLQVRATNIPSGPQGFALAISQPRREVLSLPLQYLRGIGKQIEEQIAEFGITHLFELLLNPPCIFEIDHISNNTKQLIFARLQILNQIRSLVTEDANSQLDEFSLSELLYSEPPETVDSTFWNQKKHQCTPLILVFNKRALKEVNLSILRE